MIQVIKRAFNIIECVADRGTLTLKEISDHAGIRNTTASNILKTLIDLGYLQKTAFNTYSIGGKMLTTAAKDIKRNTLLAFAESCIRDLSEQAHESVVFAVLHKGERCAIAEATYNQGVTVNTSMFQKTPIYSTATGMILLAYASDEEVKEIIEKNALFERNKWPGVRSQRDLSSAINEIKKGKYVVKVIDNSPEVVGVAVPVVYPDGRLCASLGVYLPLGRFTGSHKREVVEKLIAAGERVSHFLSL